MSPELTLPTPASFFASEPFATYTISSVPFSASAQTLFAIAVLAVAVLLSLAVVYHWLTYARHPFIGFLALGIYTVGFFFFAGLVVASGIF